MQTCIMIKNKVFLGIKIIFKIHLKMIKNMLKTFQGPKNTFFL